MKKTLIALAALAATGAFAQVSVYGLVDIGYTSKSWDDASANVGKSAGVTDGGMAGNRIGFKGAEDLGAGLKGEAVVEMGFSPTSQTQTNARTSTSGHQIDALTAAQGGGRSTTSLNRQSFVGLSGGFGTVRLGYQYTVGYEVGTLGGYTVSSEGVHGGDVAHLAGLVGGTRANGVTYMTPAMGAFSGMLQYGSGADTDYETTTAGVTNLKQTRMGLMGKFNQGPLSVALGYTSYESGTSTAPAAIVTTKGTTTQLGASYNFGTVKLAGTYNKADDGAVAKTETTAYQLGASVTSGKIGFTAAMGVAQADKSGARVTDAKTWQLGVANNLSARTAVYAYIGNTKDDGTTGIDVKNQTLVGVRHSF